MIGLDRSKIKWRYLLGDAHKGKALVRIVMERRYCMRPAGANIEKGVEVELLAHRADMDSIDFNEIAWFFRQWPRWIGVPFPPLARVREPVALQCALHGGEREFDERVGMIRVARLIDARFIHCTIAPCE